MTCGKGCCWTPHGICAKGGACICHPGSAPMQVARVNAREARRRRAEYIANHTKPQREPMRSTR